MRTRVAKSCWRLACFDGLVALPSSASAVQAICRGNGGHCFTRGNKMPLTTQIVDEAFQRYRREYDCYEKLAKFVADKVEREIIRANTLRAAVTRRAKAPAKMRAKILKKYMEVEGVNTADDAMRRVTDLAGVRISTYLESDRVRVVAEIQNLFDGPAAGAVKVDIEDAAEEEKYYRATHCQVSLKPEDLADPNDNLEGLTCEIQVCSMLAHVWNELEHDLVYKPTTGTLSARERESLSILGNMTLSGDLVIKQLFDANAERVKQAQDNAATFQDVYDFVARMRDDFPTCTQFGNNAGQLYEDLMDLTISTPALVRDQFLTAGYEARSTQLLSQLTEYVQSTHDDTVAVEPLSSDALLVLVLDSRVDDVLNLHPMGRGRGRPPRIASFAARFKSMKEQAAAGGAQQHPDEAEPAMAVLAQQEEAAPEVPAEEAAEAN